MPAMMQAGSVRTSFAGLPSRSNTIFGMMLNSDNTQGTAAPGRPKDTRRLGHRFPDGTLLNCDSFSGAGTLGAPCARYHRR